MAEKRNLPSWMLVSDNQSSKGSVKKKREGSAKEGGRKKHNKRIMYWMNERELIETALCVLNHDKKTNLATAGMPKETTVIPETDEEQTTDSELSDPGVDVAEQETLPYVDCSRKNRFSSGSESSEKHPPAQLGGLEKRAEPELDKSESTSDDEALQVLRDIFFR